MTFALVPSLALATALVAGVLVVEHYLVAHLVDGRGWPWPEQLNYALGLLTTGGGILSWAALVGVTVDLAGAVWMLGAMCLAGVPDFLLHTWEQARARRAWQGRMRDLAARNRRLAAELALLRSCGKEKDFYRMREVVEGLMFLRGGLRRDLDDLTRLVVELRPLLDEIVDGDRGVAS